VNFST